MATKTLSPEEVHLAAIAYAEAETMRVELEPAIQAYLAHVNKAFPDPHTPEQEAISTPRWLENNKALKQREAVYRIALGEKP